jgi:hypothetical protein
MNNKEDTNQRANAAEFEKGCDSLRRRVVAVDAGRESDFSVLRNSELARCLHPIK